MKRFSIYILLLTSLLFACCRQQSAVPQGSLSILSGITDNKIIFDGTAGSQVTFAIHSKLAWELLDTPGVEYNPSRGEATAEGDRCVITATVKDANNSLSDRKIGDVVFRLSNTRFTGITAYQRPQITINSLKATISAEQNIYSTFDFECQIEDFELLSEGDIVITKPKSVGSHRYSFSVAGTKDNLTNKDQSAGHITFIVSGVKQSEKVEVIQQPALKFDRSRVVVNGNIGAKSTVTVNTPFDFDVTSSTDAIQVAKGDNQTIQLITTQANNGSEERKLGTLTVMLTDNPSCKTSIDVWQRKALANKSMLFYFLGTSLKSYYESNLKMVKEVIDNGAIDHCRVVVFMQSSQNSGQLFELLYDKGLNKVIEEPISSYDLPALYSEAMIAQILKDMTTNAPAAEYGLFIGSHGKGWLPKSSSSGASTFSVGSIDDNIWVPAPGAAMVRHIGDSSNTQLNTTELAGAIKSTSCHLNYIIFDTCYMSNVESAYDLKECADYILASPCEVMASGMPYKDIVAYMAGNGDVKSRLESSAKAFVDYYKVGKEGIYSSACSAVINCNELDNLALATKRANAYLQDIDPQTVQPYDGVSASRNPTHIFFDIEDYILKSCTDSAAVDDFCKQLALTVTGQHHTDTFYSAYNNKANPIDHYSGLTTSAPILLDPASAYREDWKQTAWYKATH